MIRQQAIYLHNDYYADRPKYGIANRFTGLAAELNDDLYTVLKDPDTNTEDLPDFILQALSELGFGPQESGSDWWQKWQHHMLVVPAHVPAIYTLNTLPAKIYRVDPLFDCLLPRTAEPPTVVQDLLGPVHIDLLRFAEAEGCLRDFIDAHEYPPAEVLDGLLFLNDPNRQLIRLVDPKIFQSSLKAPYHFPYQNHLRTASATAPTGYYEGLDIDGLWNFDWIETTVAHSFREPNAMLGGQPFGAAFLSAVSSHKDVSGDAEILEVGGGSGQLAKALITHLPDEQKINYTLQDLSPKLLARQKQTLKGLGAISFHCANAEESLPKQDAYDLIISNEVIADLSMADAGPGQKTPEGCMAFIRNVVQALKPGGKAFITEFGNLASGNDCVHHLNHTEHSIHFGALIDFAESLNARAHAIPMAEFLGADSTTPLLCGQQEKYLTLRTMLRDVGHDLDFRAYDQSEFDDMLGKTIRRTGCGRLDFAPASDGLHFGPDLRQFLVLIIEKPTHATSGAQHHINKEQAARAGGAL